MKRDVDRSYLAIVVLLMLVLPLASLLIETREPGLALVGKWWNFWAIGVRLFTAEVIFHATSADSHVVVRELGIANLCIGALGIASLWLPGWRPAGAFVGLLFFGAAGVLHAIKRPAGGNEWVAMLSDLDGHRHEKGRPVGSRHSSEVRTTKRPLRGDEPQGLACGRSARGCRSVEAAGGALGRVSAVSLPL